MVFQATKVDEITKEMEISGRCQHLERLKSWGRSSQEGRDSKKENQGNRL